MTRQDGQPLRGGNQWSTATVHEKSLTSHPPPLQIKGAIAQLLRSGAEMEPIPLLTPYKMGQFDLSHRVVLAPMTRQRAYGGVPQPHAAVYYSQRATPGGLLISEATRVAPARDDEEPESFRDMPGIWAPEQVAAWRPVVDAVHAEGAVFFCQLWHAAAGDGDGVRQRQLVSPQMSFDGRREQLTSPRRVAAKDAPAVVEAFRRAARNAIDAGFDGVELQGTNGYFVVDGGGPESRCRFALEVVDAVAREIGGHRLGLRLDQFTAEPDEHALALHVVNRLNDLGVLYCHMIEPKVDGRRRVSRRLLPFREAFGGTFIASGGYGREEGDAAVGEGYADLVAYGRLFLANPDLPRRFELGAPLNDCVSATFYGAGAGAAHPAVGYTDYPFLD